MDKLFLLKNYHSDRQYCFIQGILGLQYLTSLKHLSNKVHSKTTWTKSGIVILYYIGRGVPRGRGPAKFLFSSKILKSPKIGVDGL